jgi:dTMP kinase
MPGWSEASDRLDNAAERAKLRGVAQGRFITFEGGEGGGKTTQIARLAARLEAALGVSVVRTREPGGSPGAEAIRDLVLNGAADRWSPITETLLMYASRRDHIERVIGPALAEGRWVVCDRFADSTRAYQGAAGGADMDLIASLERAVVGETRPDLTLILDLSPETGLARAQARAGGEMRFESKGLAFHQALRAAFRHIAAGEPERCAVVDADQPVETVEAAIRAVVRERLGVDV